MINYQCLDGHRWYFHQFEAELLLNGAEKRRILAWFRGARRRNGLPAAHDMSASKKAAESKGKIVPASQARFIEDRKSTQTSGLFDKTFKIRFQEFLNSIALKSGACPIASHGDSPRVAWRQDREPFRVVSRCRHAPHGFVLSRCAHSQAYRCNYQPIADLGSRLNNDR